MGRNFLSRVCRNFMTFSIIACRKLPIWCVKQQTRTASPLSTCCPMSKRSPHRSCGSPLPIHIPTVLHINCLQREYSKLWKSSASTKPLSSAKWVEKVDKLKRVSAKVASPDMDPILWRRSTPSRFDQALMRKEARLGAHDTE